ncbi:MAG: nucleotidyl transferase AbiEii/AbiGii toxin family protein [Clostridium sp.]|nr:nucleotidyl transferase AbiEii/AbiGii toxin family protein [Clostridium sp.]
MKNKKAKRSNFFNHNYTNFTEHYIANEANYYGINSKSVLERHIWIYEIHSQIQKRLKDRCILKGGACAQLYIPLWEQRCTEDLDLYTNLSHNKLKSELSQIVKELNSSKLQSKIHEYIPRSVILHGKTMPITTFIFKLPFIYKESKKSITSELKVDFLHIDINKLDINSVNNSKVLGLDLKYSPICISAYSIIGGKLLTFAVNTIGIERFKKDKLYKNVYDLFYLINRYNDVESLKQIGDTLKKNIGVEFHIKGIKTIDFEIIIEDILEELHFLSIENLRDSYIGPSERFNDFQNNYIQYDIKSKLTFDQWGIMTSHLFMWVYALKYYLINDDTSKINLICDVLVEYEYYNRLNENERLKYLDDIIRKLKEEKKSLIYNLIEEPLRLIYLYFIYFKL